MAPWSRDRATAIHRRDRLVPPWRPARDGRRGSKQGRKKKPVLDTRHAPHCMHYASGHAVCALWTVQGSRRGRVPSWSLEPLNMYTECFLRAHAEGRSTDARSCTNECSRVCIRALASATRASRSYNTRTEPGCAHCCCRRALLAVKVEPAKLGVSLPNLGSTHWFGLHFRPTCGRANIKSEGTVMLVCCHACRM